ncbi:hypothetical protein [Wielerella bovis]|uniref:hypothetical protein n=1 Tax=Wielerella bovis TaxID=2917790 RepID=UPI002019F34D|nr:hypothetical protein [Wielerella bovis]ULJ60788.1 hypothetical protein MIS44_02700 [Wielerella bovis]ULJ64045.1 hypothetical protein MIS33_07700 [Wielerella bovis]ULJ67492.1 hypothetical protein MIS31_02745 [Wielerella bovis]
MKKLNIGDAYFHATQYASVNGKPPIEISHKKDFATFEEARIYAKGALALIKYPKLANFPELKEKISDYKVTPVCEGGSPSYGYKKRTCSYYANFDYIVHQGQRIAGGFVRGDKVGRVTMKYCNNNYCPNIIIPTNEQIVAFSLIKQLFPEIKLDYASQVTPEAIDVVNEAFDKYMESSKTVNLLENTLKDFYSGTGSLKAATGIVKNIASYIAAQEINKFNFGILNDFVNKTFVDSSRSSLSEKQTKAAYRSAIEAALLNI